MLRRSVSYSEIVSGYEVVNARKRYHSQSCYGSDGGVVRFDSIIEVHSDIIEAARDELHGGDEPGGGAGSTLRHA